MTSHRLFLLAEIWRYVRDTGKISVFLFMVFLVFLGAVIVLTESSAVMPFIYTLF